MGNTVDKRQIAEILSRVYDPDYLDRSIVDMGLVSEDDITVRNGKVEIAYSLTAPMCPFSAAIGLMIKYALEKKLELPVNVSLKAGHHQERIVAELLSDPEQSAELMRKLEELGILERYVRLEKTMRPATVTEIANLLIFMEGGSLWITM